MHMITLTDSREQNVTVLSNSFIDNYMPKANGEFVKVYIYLLRLLSQAPVSFGLEQMADRLLCTEKDILRGLKYWQKEGLLSLTFDENKKPVSICLIHPGEPGEASASLPESATAISPSPESTAAYSPSKPEQEPPKEIKMSLTPDRVKELKQNEDIIQLLYIAEQYLGKTLTPTEMQKLLFFYDELKLSPDLIEYLIEYCVSRGHKSIRYIETVAMAWASDGITTVAMAKDACSRYRKEYFTILKAMGIQGRNPVETEISMMDTWLKDFCFSMELIQEACNRTVLQTGQASFQYTNKILTGWKKKNVHTLNDVRLLDAEHQKRKLEKNAARRSSGTSSSSNRFNNFQQREYDFEEYEKRLLNQ